MMVTVNLTMDEAQAVAGAMRELIERSELNEIVLGPIDWDVTTNSQGMTVKSFTLQTEKKDATRATVVATLVPDNWVRASSDENIIVYAFIFEGGSWKIDDVGAASGARGNSLKALLIKSLIRIPVYP